MNETIKVTSTARKISRSWVWRLFCIFFWLNLVLLLASLAGYCFHQEHAILGQDWTLSMRRSLQIAEYGRGRNWLMTLRGAVDAFTRADYIFYDLEGQMHRASLQLYFDAVKTLGAFLLGFECLLLLGQAISGPRRARRLLRPLDNMARAAKQLSRNARYNTSDGAKLHDLENAISRISPDQPEQRLRTGDEDLKGLEDAINSLLKRMHESYHQQAQFVSDASHELRTPIAVIQGYAGMLDRWGKQDTKILDESIAAIKSEADYMNRLIEQLLFLARGDTGRNRMEFIDLDLGDLLQDVYEDCRLIAPQHEWSIDVQPNLHFTADRDMIKQCARILTDNAVKYTPEGGAIRLRAYSKDPNTVCLQVQDSGIGISAEDAPRIFDRFYRSDPARTRQNGGTGLGLSIAQWIVQRHGGHIDLISRENIGTRMTVCLPVVPPE